MRKLKNSEIIYNVLHTFIRRISRRTTETFAIELINAVIKKLKPKYDFLSYVEIEDTLYSETVKVVSVSSDIDSVGSEEFFKAVKEIIEMTVNYLERNADYFFIKEFKESIADIVDLKLEEKDVDLNLMQYEYILDRKQEFKIEPSGAIEKLVRNQQKQDYTPLTKELDDLIKKTLSVLIDILGKKTSKKSAVETIDAIIKNLQNRYDVLKYIEIYKSRYGDGIDAVNIVPEINSVEPNQLGKATQEILQRIDVNLGRQTDLFIKDFQNKMGKEYLTEIEKMGVNFFFLQIKFDLKKY